MSAGEVWARALEAWAIPDEILASAPESPWGFPVSIFADAARNAIESPRTPTHDRVAEALPAGGVLLDVGAGGGAASLPLSGTAGAIVAVDESPTMLDALRALGSSLTRIEVVAGRWPDVAARVGPADVTVCANVVYNVPALGPFVAALTASARTRVVLELTAVHPQSAVSPLWERFWGLHRPTRPTASDALDVVCEEVGAQPHLQRWTRSHSLLSESGVDAVQRVRRRLCLPPERDPEIAAALRELPQTPREMVTAWWP